MIDLHCHILPGTDDGAEDIDESLDMARVAVADGIHTLVATPHVGNGVYAPVPEDIDATVLVLQRALDQERIPLKIIAGAEMHLHPGLRDLYHRAKGPTIGGSGRFMLLELPVHSVPSGVSELIFSLKMDGITPILAHPERNTAIQQDPDMLKQLVETGALVQVTAMSVTGVFGHRAGDCAAHLLNRRLVHVIASDAHDADYRRPVLTAAVAAAAEIFGDRTSAMDLVTRIPQSILDGVVPQVPEPR
ncbi:MAG: CpsB/CapC family capsule biosynthesis tyrosine phosphatase [Pseudomonadota bacterium]